MCGVIEFRVHREGGTVQGIKEKVSDIPNLVFLKYILNLAVRQEF